MFMLLTGCCGWALLELFWLPLLLLEKNLNFEGLPPPLSGSLKGNRKKESLDQCTNCLILQ
jgi:hypothetical protein